MSANRSKREIAHKAQRLISKTAKDHSARRSARRGKVRAESYLAGDREKREWLTNNIFSARERRVRLDEVKRWNRRQERQRGRHGGPLSRSTLEVFEYLLGDGRNFKTGAVEAAYTWIATALVMSRSTVIKAIKALCRAKLLIKLRRTRLIEDPQPFGPQVEQISNAYWFQLPAEIAAMVAKVLGISPTPVDQVQHQRDQAEQLTAMLATLSAEELALFRAGDQTPLARALAAFGRGVDRATTRV